MFKKLFLLKIFFLLPLVPSLSPHANAIIITDSDEWGRDSGAYSVLSLTYREGTPHVVKATCWGTDLRKVSPLTCRRNLPPIPLSVFLEAYAPGVDNKVFLAAILERKNSELDTWDKLLRLVSARLSNQEPNQPLFDFIASFSTEVRSDRQRTDRFLSYYREATNELFELVGWIADSEPHYVLIDTGTVPRTLRFSVARFLKTFEKGFLKNVGYVCANENPSVGVSSKNGGCQLASNNLVYSVSQFQFDELNRDTWLTYQMAYWRCRTIRAGGYADWRLPTENEISQADRFYREIGFDEFLYYWVQTGPNGVEMDNRTYALPDVLVSSQSGNTSQRQGAISSERKWDEKTTEVNRNLDAQFTLATTTQLLVRPSRESVIVKEKHYRLIDAAGTLTSQLQTEADASSRTTMERTDWVALGETTIRDIVAQDRNFHTGKRVDYLGDKEITYHGPKEPTREEALKALIAGGGGPYGNPRVELVKETKEVQSESSKSLTVMPKASRSVNPLDYVNYEPPDYFRALNQIGLMCVRGPVAP